MQNKQKIAIMSHHTPDGDAVGSMLGAYHLIRDNVGIESRLILADPVPENYKFLPGANKIESPRTIPSDYIPDVAITVDVGTLLRLGTSAEIFNRAVRKIKICHHKNGEDFADENFVDATRSSAAELIADMALGRKWKISNDAATALYTGIFADTGGFVWHWSPRLFEIAGKLSAAGADCKTAAREYGLVDGRIFNAVSGLRAKGKFELDGKLAYCIVTNADYEKYKVSYEDVKGSKLNEAFQTVRGVDVVIIAYELDGGEYHISLRGYKTHVRWVSEALGTKGGHDTSSSARIRPANGIQKSIDEIVEMFRERIK